MNITVSFVLAISVSIISFIVAFYFYLWVKKQPSSNETIIRIGALIKKGANTFLRREYTLLARFAGVVTILIILFLPSPVWTGNPKNNIIMAVCYLFGTCLSALAGVIGITVSTIANVKAAEAATKGRKPAFMAGFRGGAVMGMAVVGSSLLGITLVFWLTGDASDVLGFSFGASSLALFAKAGGGIDRKSTRLNS